MSSQQSPVDKLRARSPFFDHVMAMNEHFGRVQGSVLAGAVTFFAFVSFFPIMAVAFVAVAQVSKVWGGAEDNLVTVITQILPGIIKAPGSSGTLELSSIQKAAGTIAGIGVLAALWSALGWISGMRGALIAAFEIPEGKKPNFVMGKLADLAVFAVIGVVMLLSVSVTSMMQGFTSTILDWIGLDGSTVGSVLVYVASIVLGLAASTCLFFVIYRLLAHPDLPSKAVWQGALFGAVGFEIIKILVVKVMGGVGGSPVGQLAIALALVVWINYFNKLLMYGVAWAMTSRHSRSAIERRSDRAAAVVASADLAVHGARTARGAPVAVASRGAETGYVADRVDLGSAIIGAIAGATAALIFWRSQD